MANYRIFMVVASFVFLSQGLVGQEIKLNYSGTILENKNTPSNLVIKEGTEFDLGKINEVYLKKGFVRGQKALEAEIKSHDLYNRIFETRNITNEGGIVYGTPQLAYGKLAKIFVNRKFDKLSAPELVAYWSDGGDVGFNFYFLRHILENIRVLGGRTAIGHLEKIDADSHFFVIKSVNYKKNVDTPFDFIFVIRRIQSKLVPNAKNGFILNNVILSL